MEYEFSTFQNYLMLPYAPKLHVFDQKYSNIVKYYYNLK